MIDESLIERREYKYIIDENKAEQVKRLIEPFCSVDPNAAKQNGSYLIDSIYLDSDDLRLYDANEHEVVDRVKLRVRAYPANDHLPVFLEVKRRVNDVIAKTRGKIDHIHWADLFNYGGMDPLEALDDKNRRAVDRFIWYVHTQNARPRVMVRYEREPFFSTIDEYARVTFDRKIRSKFREKYSFERGDSDWRYIDDPIAMRSSHSMVVLELKFTSVHTPIWMTEIVKQAELHRSSYSKYGRSVLAWHTDPLQTYAVNG